jgi:diaminopimelate epimerase
MRIPFVKMHGLGNDFVMLDGREGGLPEVTADFARRIADRREGIGCDQLIVLEPPAASECDLKMRIFNADGGEVGSCGNASRAVALLIGRAARVETAGGVIAVDPREGGASVDMGVPRFGWQDIPLAYALDTLTMPVAWEGLGAPSAVNVGNPHVVFFVEDVDAVPLERLGPEIETDPLFPERVNVNVAAIESRRRIQLRVWERGAGLTRACGTGACATAVAAMRRGLIDRQVTVALPGGELEIGWGDSDRITMTGPASESFRGDFAWEDFA